MTRGEAIKDFFCKTILPVAAAALLYCIFRSACLKNGELDFHLIENAKKAVKKSGVEPQVVPVRGGTDGARLSFMGLPCPNLGTGSYACHGPYEHATAEGMDIVVDTLTELVRLYGEMK